MKKIRYPKLHVGQMGFVFREIGRVAPVILDRCEIVEIVNERYVMVIFAPDGKPEKIWSKEFIPANRRALRDAYHVARTMLDLGFRNAFISPRAPLFDDKEND